MANFQVYGPYTIPMLAESQSRLIDEKKLKDLCNQDNGIKFNNKGCYVFSIKAGRGETPIYVGRTTKSTLLKEAFNDSNIKKIFYFMNSKNKKGTLRIHLVVADTAKGKDPEKEIQEIEEYLIARAAIKNKNLLNIQGTGTPNWVIQGVANKGPGRSRTHESQFRKMIGIKRWGKI